MVLEFSSSPTELLPQDLGRTVDVPLLPKDIWLQLKCAGREVSLCVQNSSNDVRKEEGLN